MLKYICLSVDKRLQRISKCPTHEKEHFRCSTAIATTPVTKKASIKMHEKKPTGIKLKAHFNQCSQVKEPSWCSTAIIIAPSTTEASNELYQYERQKNQQCKHNRAKWPNKGNQKVLHCDYNCVKTWRFTRSIYSKSPNKA